MRLHCRRTGSTLAEVVTAVAIVTIFMFAVLNLLPASLLALQRSETQVQASTLAHSFLEGFRARPFATLSGEAPVLDRVDVDGVRYQPAVRFLELEGVSRARLKGVQVEVRWQLRGRDLSVVQEAWIARVRR